MSFLCITSLLFSSNWNIVLLFSFYLFIHYILQIFIKISYVRAAVPVFRRHTSLSLSRNCCETFQFCNEKQLIIFSNLNYIWILNKFILDMFRVLDSKFFILISLQIALSFMLSEFVFKKFAFNFIGSISQMRFRNPLSNCLIQLIFTCYCCVLFKTFELSWNKTNWK